jgi:signal transduction histidine kinase
MKQTKLLHQAVILVAVPLVFELIVVGFLGFMMWDLESALVKEANAKSIVAILTRTQATVVRMESSLVLSSLQQDHTYDRDYRNSVAQLQKNSKALRTLVKDDPKAAKLVEQSIKHADKLLSLIPELSEAMEKDMGNYNFAQFLHDQDFWMELIHATRQYGNCNAQLSTYYGKTIDELSPRAVRDRELMKFTIPVALIGSIVLAISLALHFSRTTVAALALLMENVKRFGTGEPLKQSDAVAGSVEISQLDRSFREMAEARRRAEMVRRDMVAMVSHDLRTPLSGTCGFVTLLLEGVYGDLPDRPKSVLVKMESEMHRLIRLANDLLDIEKIESNSLELVLKRTAAEDIAEDAINAVRGIAEVKGVSLNSDCDEDAIFDCDPDRLIQVLVNLLSNAIKYSCKDDTVTLRAVPVENAIKFEVQDHGPGIPEALLGVVFDRFKQLEQADATRTSGSGLGLHISKAIIESHHGSIGVDSKEGNGACFWFTIPIADH